VAIIVRKTKKISSSSQSLWK